MTEEQIKQNAETAYPGFEDLQAVYIEGAHSRDEEFVRLKAEIEDDNAVIRQLKAELAKAQNPWIDVQTDTPKEGQEVFAHLPNLCGGEYCKLTYLGNYRWSQDEGECTIEFTDRVLRWMPIPKGGEE